MKAPARIITISWNYNRAEIVADGIVHAVGAALAVALIAAVAVQSSLFTGRTATPERSVSSVAAIGRLLFTEYSFQFEVTSVLILVAMVGAVVLARRRRGLEPDEEFETKLHKPLSHRVGSMAESVGARRDR
jgi:NADH:ubiquinone oxidoreductase subunit 6 (chain J)